MSGQRREIFRAAATRRYREEKHEATAPAVVRRPNVAWVGLLLALLLAVGLLGWTSGAPVVASGQALLTATTRGAADAGAGVALLVAGGALCGCVAALTRVGRRRRVPLVRQATDVDCGAACLAMILGYFGRPTRLGECLERCEVGRDGAKAAAIVRAGRSFGLRVAAYSVKLSRFEDVLLPAVIHWHFNHFLVVERWSLRGAHVVDPALGRRWVSRDEFDAGFTGVALTFEPGAQFERATALPASMVRLYLGRLWGVPGARGDVGWIVATSILVQLLGLGGPMLTKLVVDHVLARRASELMTTLAVGAGLLVVAHMVAAYVRSATLIMLRARLDASGVMGLLERLLAAPFGFFQHRKSGDLLMRIGSHTAVREALTGQTLAAVLDGAFVIVGFVALFLQSVPFASLTLALGVAQVALLVSTHRLVRRLNQEELATQADSESFLVEMLGGVATLKASGSEERVLEHWSGLFHKNLGVSMRKSRLQALIDVGVLGIRMTAMLGLLWFGAREVIRGAMSVGTMLALTGIAAAVLVPLGSLVAVARQLQMVGAHLERLTEILATPAEQDLGAAAAAPSLTGRVEMQGVGFRFTPSGPPILEGIDLSLAPGSKVAIVGATGSGKSTLGLLLLGLLQPTFGRILFDGQDLARLNRRMVRNQMGVVLQEPVLFSSSIRQNIAFNAPHASLEDVAEAARLAGIHDEVAAMPMGYETMVGERGTCLSGGQRQRLAIARALLHRPRVLLLDEATSHLDAVTERAVDENLNAIQCTRVVIAHRLSTVKNADEILVLHKGVVAERGSHAELMARRGLYTRLVGSMESDSAPIEGGPPDQRQTTLLAYFS